MLTWKWVSSDVTVYHIAMTEHKNESQQTPLPLLKVLPKPKKKKNKA